MSEMQWLIEAHRISAYATSAGSGEVVSAAQTPLFKCVAIVTITK